MNNQILLLAAGLTLLACDRSGDDYVPAADGTYPAVIDVGEMAVMTAELMQDLQAEGSNARSWCQDNLDAEGNPYCYYGLLGRTTPMRVVHRLSIAPSIRQIVMENCIRLYWNRLLCR